MSIIVNYCCWYDTVGLLFLLPLLLLLRSAGLPAGSLRRAAMAGGRWMAGDIEDGGSENLTRERYLAGDLNINGGKQMGSSVARLRRSYS